jgi:cyclopropane-fatty-acyl-phospholipid synthase
MQPNDHLVEIGCGWGALAIHAATKYGCRVTGVTLSPAQLELAQQRVAAAGLQDRVNLQLLDYRDLTGQYDKLVSVEMIEAVGFEFHDEYFRTCCRLLKPDGRMAFQGITILDQRYQHYLSQIDFIREYIFPGGCLISNAEVLRSVTRASDFRLADTEEIGLHYAETLRRWRTEFHRQWDAIAGLGFDARFFRLWDYYLAYCEAGFAEGHVGTVQMVLDRPACIAPVKRSRQLPNAKSLGNGALNGGALGANANRSTATGGTHPQRPHIGSSTTETPSSLAGH